MLNTKESLLVVGKYIKPQLALATCKSMETVPKKKLNQITL
jgi:hypothetical protein